MAEKDKLKFLTGDINSLTNLTLKRGQVYFAIDKTKNKGVIAFDAPIDANNTKRIIMSSDSVEHATLAERAEKDIFNNPITDTYISKLETDDSHLILKYKRPGDIGWTNLTLNFLPLTGGHVSGVTTIDSLTAGDLLVNGGARFVNTILGNIETANKWAKKISLTIADSSGILSRASGPFKLDGSQDLILTLPETIQASIIGHASKDLPLTGGTLSGSLNFSNSSSVIEWNSDTYRQRIFVTDDSTANTNVFEFQQSADSGKTYKSLFTIKDNGEVIATKFTGSLNGNASTATKWAKAVNLYIMDYTGTTSRKSGPFALDGSANVNLTLPETIAANIIGHADKDLALTGGSMTGAILNSKYSKFNGNYIGLIAASCSNTFNEFVIKTKIEFANMVYMPLIKIRGYAYGPSQPIDLAINFYVYQDNFRNYGYTNTGAYAFNVSLATYTENNKKYVAINLTPKKGTLYFGQFFVDAYNSWNNTQFSPDGWTLEKNLKNDTNTTSILLTNDKVDVSQHTIQSNVDGANSLTKTTPFKIVDYTGTISRAGTSVNYNGTQNEVILPLPEVIYGTFKGNADTSTATTILKGSGSSSKVPLDSLDAGYIRYYYNVNSGLAGNMPVSNNANGILSISKHGGNYMSQLGFSSDGNIYYRSANGGALTKDVAWKTVLDSNNYTTYTVTKTGKGASGKWSIDVDGTAARAKADEAGNSFQSRYLTNVFVKSNTNDLYKTYGTTGDADKTQKIGTFAPLDSDGKINISYIPAAALERVVTVKDKTARLTLTILDVQLGDVVHETDTNQMYFVTNTEKLGTEAAFTSFAAGRAANITWSGVENRPILVGHTSSETGPITLDTAQTTFTITTIGMNGSSSTYTLSPAFLPTAGGHVTGVTTIDSLTAGDLLVNEGARFVNTILGNIETASKLQTARALKVNLASTQAVSFDGSTSVDIGVSGTLPIANGGTGATTANSAANNLLTGLPTWTANPTDSTYLIRRDTNGGKEFGQVTFLTVWNYIKSKADGVYPTKTGGNASGDWNINASTASTWKTTRKFRIGDYSGSTERMGPQVNVNGASDVVLLMPENIKGSLIGNASGNILRTGDDLGYTEDYQRIVIALCKISSGATAGTNSYTQGKLVRVRANGLTPTHLADITIQDSYSGAKNCHYTMYSNFENLSKDQISGEGFRVCTFTYKNNLYAGIEFYQVQAATFYWYGIGNFTPFRVAYYNTNSKTVLNQEIKDSISYGGCTRQPLYIETVKGKLEGNATSATKLATPRALKVNLASTNAVNFDGTQGVDIGVSGTLPIANGGTGATTAAGARKNLGAVNIAGDTMTGTLYFPNNQRVVQKLNDSSNWALALGWQNATKETQKNLAGIGRHNTGGNSSYPGTISIVPYATDENPWGRKVGLNISKDNMLFEGYTVIHTGNLGNYYWANVQLSTTSSTTTQPTFGKVIVDNTAVADCSTSTSASIRTNGGMAVKEQMAAKTIKVDNGSSVYGCVMKFNQELNCLEFTFA